MHTCEECGQACYCDMDDTPLPVDLEECDHECQEFGDEDGGPFESWRDAPGHGRREDAPAPAPVDAATKEGACD